MISLNELSHLLRQLELRNKGNMIEVMKNIGYDKLANHFTQDDKRRFYSYLINNRDDKCLKILNLILKN